MYPCALVLNLGFGKAKILFINFSSFTMTLEW